MKAKHDASLTEHDEFINTKNEIIDALRLQMREVGLPNIAVDAVLELLADANKKIAQQHIEQREIEHNRFELEKAKEEIEKAIKELQGAYTSLKNDAKRKEESREASEAKWCQRNTDIKIAKTKLIGENFQLKKRIVE